MIKKIFFFTIIISAALLLAQVPALAQDYGPPTDIPMGPPAGAPTGDYNMGPPANIPTGPSDSQLQAAARGEEMQKKGEEQQLKGVKKGAAGLENALKKMENQFAKIEKGGATMSDATREKLADVRTGIETIKNAQTASDVENVDMDALQEKLSSLGDEIGGYQKMLGLKKMLASMNRGVTSFEKQLAKLQKQGVTAPATVTDDLAKLKAGLQAINDAKTPEELDNANPDELGDLMTKINESRPILEMAAKWPRVLKQADQQLTSFNKQLAKTKTLVDKLTAQGFDVSADLATFQADITELQTARDAANDLMKAGSSEEAFTKIEEDFFNKLDNAGEHQRAIQNMANLGRFNSEFKRGMADAQKTVKTLTKKKLDTSELQSIYEQSVTKGNEILDLIKAKPIDNDAIASAMDAMESLKQNFMDKADELSGGPAMPWEDKAKPQFSGLSLPKDFDKTISQITGK